MLERFRRRNSNLSDSNLPAVWSGPSRELGLFNDDFFAPFSLLDRWMTRPFNGDRWLPAMDVREDADAYRVAVELPGLAKKDISVTVEDNVLTVSGERRWENEEEEKGRVHRVERAYGSFSRSFSLPRTVKADEVKADFKDGVLNLSIPKADEAKPQQIAIN